MSFKNVAWQAIGYIVMYKRQLAQALLIPSIIYMALDIVVAMETISTFISFVIVLLAIIIQTIIAITTHRIILLGPDSISKWGHFEWSKRETMFTLCMIGLSLAILPFYIFAFIPFVGWLITLGAYVWIFSRFSLVFPGIAVDQGVTFKLSWHLTKNRKLMMFLVVIILPIFLVIPTLFLDFIVSHLSLTNPSLYTIPITSFLSLFATVFTVAALSISYKLIYEDTYTS